MIDFKSDAGNEIDRSVNRARITWEWSGAASLSQLAVSGTSNPSGCKFPAVTPEHKLYQAIENITCTEEARKSIESVPVWKA